MQKDNSNLKKHKKGYKFFWLYLILGCISACGNLHINMQNISSQQYDYANVLYYKFEALLCAIFVLTSIIFVISTLFKLKYIYKIAYYMHNIFLLLLFIAMFAELIARFHYDEYMLGVINFLVCGALILLDFLYFKKRNKLQAVHGKKDIEDNQEGINSL